MMKTLTVGAFVLALLFLAGGMRLFSQASGAGPRAAGESARICAYDERGAMASARVGERVYIKGGNFLMGSNDYYPEEAPAVSVEVSDFFIRRNLVTNLEFRNFVDATGYVTTAERTGLLAPSDEGPDELRQPGSAVFVYPEKDIEGQWKYIPGASWKNPEGPGSSIAARLLHPVVHVSHEDARAYAAWAREDLPTEAQWEYAARGGLVGQSYAWGGRFAPNGEYKANTWQGQFPASNLLIDGFLGTSPVACFEGNGHGLFDMIGNVWEWTDSWYKPGHDESGLDPRGATRDESRDPRKPGVQVRVVKGGSHLCAPNACARYRPAARESRHPDWGTSHIGFRTVSRAR